MLHPVAAVMRALAARTTADGEPVQPHRQAGEVAEHGLDAAGVLAADPVELEAVGHAQRHPHGVVVLRQHFGRRQRADPGVELLFRQFAREALAATLP